MRDNSVVESLRGEEQRTCRTRWPAVLVWAIFGVGLLVQAFSPGLRIEHNKFVAPVTISQGQEIHPDKLIARERTVQLLSATLTLGGALGLAFCYGPALFRRREGVT
jgi:hypothetical protein